ncbi:hypothetical protein ACFWBC_05650 [Streptomyces sp. NPDC059985]|uniref:hypothetical protein n=1 Tax=Streptomyces sp. NPDC059985 TaxID=3347025 RepID=UPI0036A0AF1F
MKKAHTDTVGVQRQYTGTAGRIENAQGGRSFGEACRGAVPVALLGAVGPADQSRGLVEQIAQRPTYVVGALLVRLQELPSGPPHRPPPSRPSPTNSPPTAAELAARDQISTRTARRRITAARQQLDASGDHGPDS